MADGPSLSSSVPVQQLLSSSSSLSRQSRRSSSMPQSNNNNNNNSNRQQQQQQQSQQHSQLTVNSSRRNSLSKIIASSAVVLVERAPIKRLVSSSTSSTNSTAATAATVLLKKQDANVVVSASATKKDKDAKVCAGSDNVMSSSNDNNVSSTSIVTNSSETTTISTAITTTTITTTTTTTLPVVVVTRGAAKKARQEDLGPSQPTKKRCADRYDSSESSDSGVATSCGDCSSSSLSSLSSGGSSGGSDITEPGSPCSTTSSSDEGVVCNSNNATIPNVQQAITDKLAPTPQPTSRQHQWPWQPPLAQTLHSSCTNGYKRFKSEPEPGSTPRLREESTRKTATSAAAAAAAAATAATASAVTQKDSQGKITEYFMTQIKPPAKGAKKNQPSEVPHSLSKGSPEFRRPNAVQQRQMKNGNGRTSSRNWMTRSLLALRNNNSKNNEVKKPSATATTATTTTTTNMTQNQQERPVLPIPNEVLSSLPPCIISDLRLTSDAYPSVSPPPGMDSICNCNGFKDHAKQDFTTGYNLTEVISDATKSMELLSRMFSPPTPSDSAKDEDEEEEESSRDSALSKTSSLSPILTAPTTIRFPAKTPNKQRNQTPDSGFCRWDQCGVDCDTTSALIEHLQAVHINSQTSGDNFVCHWQGCKVQGKASCSRRWLERHVLSHGGNKPFQCIVDGCGSRFSSQTALERHVNGHFNQSDTNSATTSRKSTENKLVRRNGKKLRYRRQPWSARIFDYFDPGVMESLKHRLVELEKTRTQGRLAETPGNSMVLTSQIMARRTELDGTVRVLLRWQPEDIEPDEWVLESEAQSIKYVNIRSAVLAQPDAVKAALYPAFTDSNGLPQQRVKQRRKPLKQT